MALEKTKIEQIKSQTSIVDLISEYVDLEKKGTNYLGLCPFHNEKTPSFNVNEEKGFYHCFGCQVHGSVIDFYMEMENTSFNQALKILGERIGIKVNIKDENVNSKDMQIIKMHNIMVDLYHEILTETEEGSEALDYLLERGFTREDIKKEKIGLSPKMNDGAIRVLERLNYSKEMMYQAGLVARNEETFQYFDRFRNRIMIPIKNHKGNYVGFTGRALKEETPKYLNTPETNLFQKRKLIFNLNEAFKVIRDRNEVILMEGHMDVLKVKSTNVKNVVGTMGTSVSEEHIEILKHATHNITLMFDGDEAGQNATTALGDRLIEHRCNTYVIPLGNKMDPDEFIETQGQTAFEKYVYENKIHYIIYNAKENMKKAIGNDLIYTESLTHTINLLKYIDDEVLSAKLVHEVSKIYEIDDEIIKKRLPNRTKKSKNFIKRESNITSISPRKFKERTLLHTFFNNKQFVFKFRDNINSEIFKIEGYYDIFNKLVDYFSDFDSFNETLFLSYVDPDQKDIVQEISMTKLPIIYSESHINDYLDDLSGIKSSSKKRQELIKQIEQAELLGNIDMQLELLQQLIELDQSHKL